jgi:beta-1,4-mannosyl-glycoprotein beta-1,4-N-acetylglucosaminyltransferase
MIIDCITFYDGIEVLEIRLNALAPYIGKFVICESPYDMVGKSKPLIFNENKDRFKDFNITHLIVPDHPDHMFPKWEPYYYQIDYIMEGLKDAQPDDMIFLSDFDEIPNMTNYQMKEGYFRQVLYYYYLNAYTGEYKWYGTTATFMKNIINLRSIRQHNKRTPIVGEGWHFSYVCSEEDIIKKIESFCHRELDNDVIKSRVYNCKKELRDPFGRYKGPFNIQDPSGPSWLLENREKYKHLFY